MMSPPTEKDKTRMTSFKLQSTPAQVNSPTYTFKMQKLDESKNLCQGIQFAYDMPKVITGSNITTADIKKVLCLQVLTGPLLQNFNNGFNEAMADVFKQQCLAAYAAARTAGHTSAKAQNAMAVVPESAACDDFITAGLHAILTYISPHKALAKQKHWMRCNCRKPTTMSVQEYTNNLRQINKQRLRREIPVYHRN
jgi:hypothetical protein